MIFIHNNIFIKKYNLSDIAEINAHTSINTLYTAYSGNFKRKIVLKFYKHLVECHNEANFIRFYQKPYFVELLDSLPEHSMNIFEKIEPGISYEQDFPQNEEHTILDVCTIVEWMRSLHIESTKDFQNVSSYFNSLKEDCLYEYKLPIKKCKMIFDELLSTSNEHNQYILHGDLHHGNILKSKSHECGFAVIDPKGIIGECEFELACFILNPIAKLTYNPNVKKLIEERIETFSTKLHLDSSRLRKWCFVKAILGTCFAIEDNFLETADKFASLAKIFAYETSYESS